MSSAGVKIWYHNPFQEDRLDYTDEKISCLSRPTVSVRRDATEHMQTGMEVTKQAPALGTTWGEWHVSWHFVINSFHKVLKSLVQFKMFIYLLYMLIAHW